jgi:methylated-DNA-[protein]-cysteine S-methyltransferase
MKRCAVFYQIIKVGKEEIGLVWDNAGRKPMVEYIYLPNPKRKLKDRIITDFPAINKIQRKIPGGIDILIAKLYSGQKEKIELSALNLSRLTEFAAKVLKQTCKIPRGKVVTYSGMAAKIGAPLAARAVGTALANNPFPIIIPCHRVVRAGGSTGQFGGGAVMKKQLLKREGVALDKNSIVPPQYVIE